MLMAVSLRAQKSQINYSIIGSSIFIGKISYGIYVYHFYITTFFENYIYDGSYCLKYPMAYISSIIYTVICTAISVLIAWISWTVIESQVLNLKGSFKY